MKETQISVRKDSRIILVLDSGRQCQFVNIIILFISCTFFATYYVIKVTHMHEEGQKENTDYGIELLICQNSKLVETKTIDRFGP